MSKVKETLRVCDYCYTKDQNKNFYPCTKPDHLITIKPLNGYSICETCLKEQHDEEEKRYISEQQSVPGTVPYCTWS